LNALNILDFFIPKYAAFQSRILLAASRSLLRELYFLDKPIFLSAIVRNLDSAVVRVSLKPNAPSNYFTLLTWVNETLILACNDQEDFTKYVKDLIRYQATLLQHCLEEGRKRGIKSAALRNTKAATRAVLRDTEYIETAIQSYLSIFLGSGVSPFAAGVELGILAGISKQLVDKTASVLIEQSKGPIYEFFIKDIIGSKVRIPQYVMVGLFCIILIDRTNFNGFSQDLQLERTWREYYSQRSLAAFLDPRN